VIDSNVLKLQAVAVALDYRSATFTKESGRDFYQVKKTLEWRRKVKNKQIPMPNPPRSKYFF
jgi:hypothetical protein